MEGVCWGDITGKSQGMTYRKVVLQNSLGILIKNQGLTLWGIMRIEDQKLKTPLGNVSSVSCWGSVLVEDLCRTCWGDVEGFVGLSGDYDIGVKGFACLAEDSAGDL